MYTEQYRTDLRNDLIEAAQADNRIVGVAITGSGSIDDEDAWSDIDLALGVSLDHPLDGVIDSWTETMYEIHGAVDHLDVSRGNTIYRVFLLANSLQVDVAFSPEPEFGAVGPTWLLIAGISVEQEWMASADPREAIGMAWLYALHARSSIARGRFWQAEYMISGMRDEVLSLACIRHDLPASQGRGVDRLSVDIRERLKGSLIAELTKPALLVAFKTAVDALILETAEHDEYRSKRIAPILYALVTSAHGSN